MDKIGEKSVRSLPGILVLLAGVGLVAAGVFAFISGLGPIGIVPVLIGTVMMAGLYTVAPNQSAVLSLFGKYVGTVDENGLRWNNIFYSKNKVSKRVRNFESGKLKVNELGGSPIEIAAIVVWEVSDAAEAVFNVDDYVSFVKVQSEAAIRSMATSYPYDPNHEGEVSLRTHPDEISERLRAEVQDRLEKAGINVIEARISHLAYSPEIAAAMLQRQQAGAVVAARTQIVEGAVGMVEMALAQLERDDIVTLSDESKGRLVGNLLTVLCSDRHTQPVVNTGS